MNVSVICAMAKSTSSVVQGWERWAILLEARKAKVHLHSEGAALSITTVCGRTLLCRLALARGPYRCCALETALRVQAQVYYWASRPMSSVAVLGPGLVWTSWRDGQAIGSNKPQLMPQRP